MARGPASQTSDLRLRPQTRESLSYTGGPWGARETASFRGVSVFVTQQHPVRGLQRRTKPASDTSALVFTRSLMSDV